MSQEEVIKKIKNISIETGGIREVEHIAAEAQYVDVSLDENGDIVEDINVEPVFSTSSLTSVLIDLKENAGCKYVKDGENHSVIEGAVTSGTMVDPTDPEITWDYPANIASGFFSHVEGRGICIPNSATYPNVSSGEGSHAEGIGTTANESGCHAEGGTTYASGYYSHAEGSGTTSFGEDSHAEGYNTYAKGDHSHAEGRYTSAIGTWSHVEGENTYTVGSRSHAEGNYTSASGDNSHAEGYYTRATGFQSHAEGSNTTATGFQSHAEGFVTLASGDNSHAEGSFTTASGRSSHAEGDSTSASGFYSHAEGENTIASEYYSHAEGRGTTASGYNSHAGNYNTIANYYQTVVGQNNIAKGDSDSYTANSGYFIVGSGTDSAQANCFRATESNTYGKTYSTSGADYAEMFEWQDSNSNNEDRVGKFVTLDGDKIKLATSEDDYIIGIVSGNASVIGDVYEDEWQGMFETDIYGRPIYTKQHINAVLDEEGNELIPAHDNDVLKISSDYDNTKIYIPRSQRPEWDAVGLIGKLVCLDDGTAVVNQYVKPNDDSIAIHSDERTKYRVMERIDENHIRVMIL